VSRQEDLYSHPYHYLPHAHGNAWKVSRSLFWGYEYLGILNTVLTLVRGKDPCSVLDFGCGDGRLLYELSQNFTGRLVGVDRSHRALTLARGMNMGPQGDTRIEFCNSLDQIEGVFDVVTTVETLEHIPDRSHRTLTMKHPFLWSFS